MATNNTLTLIQSVTVGAGGAAEINFTSIPQTYTDLVVKYTAAYNVSGANTVRLTFNNNSSGYSYRALEASGSSVTSGSFSGAYLYGGYVNGTNGTTSTFSSNEIYIPNYTSSNNKSISSDYVLPNNSTTNVYTIMLAQLWANSSAITSLKLVPETNAFVQYTTAYLYGVAPVTASAKATGGIITQDDTYIYHTFLSSGTFTPTQSLTANYLVVAGGGGSTGDRGGGGGAGGVRCTVGQTGGGGSLETPLSLTAQAYAVTIGAGAAGRGVGSNSEFSTITSNGGGGGGRVSQTTGQNGGSGGGGDGETGSSRGLGTANQGFDGGNGAATGAGGGGGASQVGAAGQGTEGSGYGGAGGTGILTTMANSGIPTYYGGGGGGYGNLGGQGGLGGGGKGSDGSITTNATNGTANTGGGAGGTHNSAVSTNGGSGIVVIRYAK